MASVLAGSDLAVGSVAVRALVAGHAGAGEVVGRPRVHGVSAARAIFARQVPARYLLQGLAQVADVLLRALALEGSRQIFALSTVLTRAQRHALVHVLLAPVVWHRMKIVIIATDRADKITPAEQAKLC